jgi:hypothetical protein
MQLLPLFLSHRDNVTPRNLLAMGESTPANANVSVHLGFITVVEHEQLGLIGGYLLLNQTGRPLEFHCTAPVKPSRAQQILYGPTLAPYLYGEQIAEALIAKSQLRPLAVFANQLPVLAVRELVELPTLLLAAGEAAPDDASGQFGRLQSHQFGPHKLFTTESFVADAAALSTGLNDQVPFDLTEPFDRIREAIEEAQRAATNRQAA